MCTDLELGVGPAGDLNDHVQNRLLGIGVEGNVVERRDGLAILLDVDAVLQGVRSTDLAHRVAHFGTGRRLLGRIRRRGCCGSAR